MDMLCCLSCQLSLQRSLAEMIVDRQWALLSAPLLILLRLGCCIKHCHVSIRYDLLWGLLLLVPLEVE